MIACILPQLVLRWSSFHDSGLQRPLLSGLQHFSEQLGVVVDLLSLRISELVYQKDRTFPAKKDGKTENKFPNSGKNWAVLFTVAANETPKSPKYCSLLIKGRWG